MQSLAKCSDSERFTLKQSETGSRLRISLCEDEDAPRWQEFVAVHSECCAYHRWPWKRVFEKSFGWPTFYLIAEEGAKIRGILPLVWQRNWPLGNFVSSMPHVKVGGIVGESAQARDRLLEEAVAVTRRVGGQYLELRLDRKDELSLPCKTGKVMVVLDLDRDLQKMWMALHKKVRSDVRKSMSFGLTAQFGRENLLKDFYAVLCQNMRDLGSPVYSMRFFSEILRAFPTDTHICVVRHQDRPIASSFLVGFRDSIEAYWSSSLHQFLCLKPNMFLYWNLLCFASEQGYRVFDFGRSSLDSGTYRFKMQWGGRTIPLYWFYWPQDGHSLPSARNSLKYGVASQIWRRLPVAVTRKLGPRLIKYIPGI